jgi:hypothetical protein
VSKSTGKQFYYEAATKQTCWVLSEIPGYAAFAAQQLSSSSSSSSKPSAAAAASASAPASASALAAPAAPVAAAALPAGWASKISKSTGKQFFFNAATGKTAWHIDDIAQ